MHIICLTPVAPGVFNDVEGAHIITPPAGWARIPEDFPLPATFPRLGSIEAEELPFREPVQRLKMVLKTREVETGEVDAQGLPVTEPERYFAPEVVTEERERTVMTVTAMTEGNPAVPDPGTRPTGDVWAALDAAYQEGVDGV